jgi:hypothetical protein
LGKTGLDVEAMEATQGCVLKSTHDFQVLREQMAPLLAAAGE